MRRRVAPSDVRIAISPSRITVRANTSVATFAQMTTSRKASRIRTTPSISATWALEPRRANSTAAGVSRP